MYDVAVDFNMLSIDAECRCQLVFYPNMPLKPSTQGKIWLPQMSPAVTRLGGSSSSSSLFAVRGVGFQLMHKFRIAN